MKAFLASKKLRNVTENPLEGTLDISKPEYIFILRIRTVFWCIKKALKKAFDWFLRYTIQLTASKNIN